jgi:ATP-dependent exoDNAse (exonuclease V) alpha subunit
MAIYHLHLSIISRGKGKSAVASAAYRAGERIKNEYDGIIHDYTRKTGIVHSEILAPSNAPDWVKCRSILWNEVEKTERRSVSRLAREIEVSLPIELNSQQQLELVRDFAYDCFVKEGMIADIAIHDKKDGNPHAHIMLTTREISKEGFTVKNRNWDKREMLQNKWRPMWAEKVNQHLKEKGIEQRIDHRSYEEQGIEKIPTVHKGKSVTRLEKRGVKTRVGDINREIEAANREIQRLRYLEEQYKQEITKAQELIALQKNNAMLQNKSELHQALFNKIADNILLEKVEREEVIKTAEIESKQLIQQREQYIKLEHEKQELIDIQEHQRFKINSIKHQIKNLNYYQENIDKMNNELKKLTEERKKLGILQGKQKKILDIQIKDYNNRLNQSIKELEKNFGIKPDQIEQEKALRNQLIETYQAKDLTRMINDIEQKQREIELFYKYNKVLIEFKDQEYRDLINQMLEKQRRDSQNLNSRILEARVDSKLNNLSQKDKEDIKSMLSEQQARMFDEKNKPKTKKYMNREIGERELPNINLQGVDWGHILMLESKGERKISKSHNRQEHER